MTLQSIFFLNFNQGNDMPSGPAITMKKQMTSVLEKKRGNEVFINSSKAQKLGGLGEKPTLNANPKQFSVLKRTQ